MALHTKFHMLEALEPDIAIVPEAATTARLMREGVDSFTSAAWIGRNDNKGLLALSFGDWKLRRLSAEWDQRLEWVMPLAVTGPAAFNLLAMWSQNTRAGIRYPSEAFEYPQNWHRGSESPPTP